MGPVNNICNTKILPTWGKIELPNISKYDPVVIELVVFTATPNDSQSLERYILFRG